jgi:hypothetical protein
MGKFAETAIFNYCFRLPTKENKCPFFVSKCSKQTEVCRFCFLFAEKKTEVAVSISLVFCLWNSGNADTWTDKETWGNADLETWKHGHKDKEIWTWTWRLRNSKRKMEAQLIFLNMFTVCSLCKRKFVVFPFVDEETN